MPVADRRGEIVTEGCPVKPKGLEGIAGIPGGGFLGLAENLGLEGRTPSPKARPL